MSRGGGLDLITIHDGISGSLFLMSRNFLVVDPEEGMIVLKGLASPQNLDPETAARAGIAEYQRDRQKIGVAAVDGIGKRLAENGGGKLDHGSGWIVLLRAA